MKSAEPRRRTRGVGARKELLDEGTERPMNDYLVMILDREAAVTPADLQTLSAGHAEFGKSVRASGIYRDGERLRPEAKRVKGRDVLDGPFPETNGALGGYYILRAESLEAATEIATRCPMLDGDTIEVRQVMKGELEPVKTDKPGKVFAFAVVGDNRVMDRVDAETAPAFHHGDGTFLGGVRLEATGRRVLSERGQRRVIEGPFAETKEVIGGLFFLRLPSIDAAVRFALDSKFIPHVALEIRELRPKS
jgi:hypothetical protein